MTPRLIDTHCHIHFNAYKHDAAVVIQETLGRGVWMITVGTQKDTSKNGVACAQECDEGLYASVGLHPNHLFPVFIDEAEGAFTSREEDFDYAYYKSLCASKKVVAIGECGLDYYRIPETLDINTVKAKQDRVFRAHLDLSHELHLPVICHIRDAHDETISVLKEYVGSGKLSRRGVIHCYTSDAAHALQYVELGFYVSFTGIITFEPKNNNTQMLHTMWDAVRAAPLDRVLIETDAPYLTPIPHRGKRNHPLYVEFVAQKIAEIKGLTVDEVAKITTKNARALFRI